MSTHATLTAPARAGKRGKTNPLSSGLPDPRPLTDYSVLYQEVAGKSRITVTLQQPCIIRAPQWGFIDCSSGEASPANQVTPVGHDTIIFDFNAIIPASVNLVNVPYQDTQVQNFQGGFVRPGAQWFRAPK